MTPFSLFDGVIAALYFAIVLVIGWLNRKQAQSTESFIGSDRQMPWLAVLGSLVATEVSAATFLATPGVGYSENMNYLQFGIGSILARLMIAFVFIGAFYAFNSLTIYEFLAKRFGNGTRYTATCFFIVTRLLASAVRLMIAATGLSLILGVPFWVCLMIFTIFAMAYTGSGGIRGIIWTDVLQAIVFIGGGLSLVAYIGSDLSWQTIIDIGKANGSFEVFRFEPAKESASLWDWFNDSKLLYVAVLFGFASTAGAFGTDQDMTQRMLTCRDVKSARRSVILSGFIAIPIAALFLFVGIALFAYYQTYGDTELPGQILADGSFRVATDKVFPTFLANELPSGLRGLLLIGVLAAAMSSLDSTMGALSYSALVDLYRPILKKHLSREKEMRLSKVFVALFGLALALIAYALKDAQGLLWLSFQLSSVTYGALLGVFLLGILTQRGNDRGNAIGMLSAGLICASLLGAIKMEWISLGWTWLIFIGCGWSFLVGFAHKKGSSSISRCSNA